jgi:hypothetical protein
MLTLLLTTALAAPTCQSRALTAAVEALEKAIPADRAVLAANAISEACDLKDDVEGVLTQLAATPPEHRRALDASLIEKQPKRWVVACTGGLETAKRSIEVAPEHKRNHLWGSCQLAKLDFATKPEWDGAEGLLYAPIVLSPYLDKSGLPRPTRRALVRGLAGLPPR